MTSDIIFLQKRDHITDLEQDWVHLDTDENGIRMNRYFVQHPEMILGDMVMESTRFGPDSACKAREGEDLSEQLANAIQFLQAEIKPYELEELDEEEDKSIPADPTVKNFSYTLVDGQVYYRENSLMHPVEVSVTAENRIRGMIELRECVRRLIEYQTEGYPDEDIAAEQQKLNVLYDSFTAKYGLINSRGNKLAFSEDSSYCLLCSLEVLDEQGNLKRKADMFSKRTIRCDKRIAAQIGQRRQDVLRVLRAANIPVNHPGKFLFQFLRGFPRQLRHIVHIHTGFFRNGHRQRFTGRVHAGDSHMGTDGALGEHIGFSF